MSTIYELPQPVALITHLRNVSKACTTGFEVSLSIKEVREIVGMLDAMAWQPIETALKDGKPLLCRGSYRENSQIYQAEWHATVTWHQRPDGGHEGKDEGAGGWFCSQGGGWTPMSPAFWMLLPSPPSEVAEFVGLLEITPKPNGEVA